MLAAVAVGAITTRPPGRGALAVMLLWPVPAGFALERGIGDMLAQRVGRDPARARSETLLAFSLSSYASIVAVALGWFFFPYVLPDEQHHLLAPLRLYHTTYTPIWLFTLSIYGGLAGGAEFSTLAYLRLQSNVLVIASVANPSGA